MNKKEILEKLYKEKAELNFKIIKLTDYIKSDEFVELSDRARMLLIQQRDIMKEYSFILTERYKLLEDEINEE